MEQATANSQSASARSARSGQDEPYKDRMRQKFVGAIEAHNAEAYQPNGVKGCPTPSWVQRASAERLREIVRGDGF